jgi:hypothetical protein
MSDIITNELLDADMNCQRALLNTFLNTASWLKVLTDDQYVIYQRHVSG